MPDKFPNAPASGLRKLHRNSVRLRYKLIGWASGRIVRPILARKFLSNAINLNLVLDLSKVRPTYGDTFPIVILARVLTAMGSTPTLVLDSSNGLRRDWLALEVASYEEIKAFLTQFHEQGVKSGLEWFNWKIAVKEGEFAYAREAVRATGIAAVIVQEFELLRKSAGVLGLALNVLRVLSLFTANKFLARASSQPKLTLDVGRRGADLQYLSPRLLNFLWKQMDGTRESEAFFIDGMGFSSQEKKKLGLPETFPCLHFRLAQYKTERNLTNDELSQTFRAALRMTGSKAIVICAPPSAENAYLDVLNDLSSQDDVRIISQPQGGFMGAVRTALSASHYFQNLGGGVGVVPFFSRVPYVQTLFDYGPWPTPYRGKVAKWSSPRQFTIRVRDRQTAMRKFVTDSLGFSKEMHSTSAEHKG